MTNQTSPVFPELCKHHRGQEKAGQACLGARRGFMQKDIPVLSFETHAGVSQGNPRGKGVKKQGPFRKQQAFP